MGNDGKIKNGIELKEAEGNCIQRIIKKILKRLSEKTEVWYSLSYDEEKHRYFDKEFLLKYLNENYLDDKNKEIDENNLDDKNKEIYEKNLINDLITFKTYRDAVDINVRKESDFGHFITICLAFIPIIISVMLDYDSKISISLFAGFLVLVNLVFYKLTTGSKSESYKLKVINNVIYTLETIKEEMEKNENSGMKNTEMNCNVNDYQSDYKTDEKITEAKSFTKNDEGSYDGLELTEVREIRTYKPDKNKYSPRAMHERKRR